MAYAPADDLGRHPIFDEVRQTTTLTVRLGVKRKKGDDEYPEEVDYFVLKPEDGATPEILEAYGPKPKDLRLMLLHPAPERQRPRPTDDLVCSIYNTAWGWNSGLLCKGTGADEHRPGRFVSFDKDFAGRVAHRVGATLEENPDGTWSGPCFGTACPKYRHMIEKRVEERGRVRRVLVLAPIPFGDLQRDPDAPCKLSVLFKAALLHPTDPDPAHILALVQIASGSVNTIKDLLYAFDMIRDHTVVRPGEPGRTEKVPFWIFRKNTITTKGARRTHYTLAIRPTPTEWAKYARIPVEELNLPPALIAELMALRESLNAYRDIVPRPLELAAPAGADLNELERRTHASHTGGGVRQGSERAGIATDADETVADAAHGPTFAPDPELDRPLSDPERAALKDVIGVERQDPDDPMSQSTTEGLRKLHRWVRLFDQEHGIKTKRLSELTVRHDRWIRAQLAPPPQSAGDEDDIPEQAAEPATGGGAAAPSDGGDQQATPVQDALWRETPTDEEPAG